MKRIYKILQNGSGTLFIMLCVVLVCSTTCKDRGPVPTEYLPQEFKDWMYFKEGTWWHYESMDGVVDKVVVDTSFIDMLEWYDYNGKVRDDEPYFIEEWFEYTTTSQLTNAQYKYYSGAKLLCDSIRTRSCSHVLMKQLYSSGEGGPRTIFFYEPIVGSSVGAFVGGTELLALRDTMTVKGITYNEVAEIKQYYYRYGTITYQIAKHFGIIRKIMEYEDGTPTEQWDLVDSHIVQ